MIGRQIRGRRVARSNGRQEAPDSVDAPTAIFLQRSAVPFQEGDLHRTMNSACPVVHRTVRCATRQKARIVVPDCLQRLLAALGL
jgi:hypothetical protein